MTCAARFRQALWLNLLLVASPALAANPATPDGSQPRLGQPWQLELPLPTDAEALLGLPPLPGFVPLQPPRLADGRLQLVLLPLRPGQHWLPSLPVALGPGRQYDTPPLVVAVPNELPETADWAPLKELPAAPVATAPDWRPGIAVGLILAAALALALRWLGRRHPHRRRPANPNAGEDPRLLALARQLNGTSHPRRAELLRDLERLRFAPGGFSEARLARLEASWRTLAASDGEAP